MRLLSLTTTINPNLIESDEGRLKRSQFDQQGDGLLVVELQLRHLLTAASQTRQLVYVGTILLNKLKGIWF